MLPKYATPTLLLLALTAQRFLVAQSTVVDFESVGLAPEQTLIASAAAPDTVFRVDGVGFPSLFTSEFGGFWSGGWAFTRSTAVRGDFNNLVGSAPGGDLQIASDGASGTYAVGQQQTFVLLPPGAGLSGITYTNTAYAAAVVRDGSQFSRAFGIGANGASGVADSLILSLAGYYRGVPTFVQNLPLADFRFADDADDYILTTWRSSDVGEPGRFVETDSVTFRLLSSDNGAFGNNTPDFFAVGALQLNFAPVSTREIARVRPLGAYPNPCRGSVTLDVAGATLGEVYVTDASGRVVFRQSSYYFGTALHLPALPEGPYWVLAQAAGLRYATSLHVD